MLHLYGVGLTPYTYSLTDRLLGLEPQWSLVALIYSVLLARLRELLGKPVAGRPF